MLLLCFEGCKYGCWCWSEVEGNGDEKEDGDDHDDHDDDHDDHDDDRNDGVTWITMIMTRMICRP